MALKSEAATVAALDALNALADAGQMIFYDGTVPAAADTGITTQSQLANITPLEATAFTAASISGTDATSDLVIGTGKSDAADAAGVVTFYRIVSSGGTIVHQGTCGLSGEDVNFSDTNWNIGGVVTVTGLTVTLAV